ncbi:hypothetical protein ACFL4J_01560 [Candidatus Margulisiibacteriota bacterium]
MKIIFPAAVLFCVILGLSSCSVDRKRDDRPLEEKELDVVQEQIATPEAPPREPVFIYQDQPERIPSQEVVLSLDAEPVLLTSGYVRLVGVVSGGRPLALIEVAGKGLGVAVGQSVGGYKVLGISERGVKLRRTRKAEDA